MKRRQQNWYVVKEDRAREFAARGFPIKQKANGKWMVLCHPSRLYCQEQDRKGLLPKDEPYDYAADDFNFDAAREDRIFGRR